MKKTWLLPILLLTCCQLYGQKYKTIELKPIAKQGWNYFYDLKKVKSPYTLQFPLMAVEDQEVDKFYKSFQTIMVVSRATTVIPLIYILSQPASNISQETFWFIWGGSIVAAILFEVGAHSQLGRAVDRYNLVIYQPSGQSLGASLSFKF